jgi:glyoxylase-like metal-dependent hydrolase (beta-lactamase superfamily II)
MQIKRVVNSVFTSNTYILLDAIGNKCWLIDMGDVQPVLENLPEGIAVEGIFLTHTHYDHIYGINKMVELYPDCVVYTSEKGKLILGSIEFFEVSWRSACVFGISYSNIA